MSPENAPQPPASAPAETQPRTAPDHPRPRLLRRLLAFFTVVCALAFLIALVTTAATYTFPKSITATNAKSPQERSMLTLISGELLYRLDLRWSRDPESAAAAADPYAVAQGSGLSLGDSFPPLTPGVDEEFSRQLPGVYTLIRTKPLSPAAAARTSTRSTVVHSAYVLAPTGLAAAAGMWLLRRKPAT